MSNNQNILPETGFVRLNQVLQVFPVGKTTWYAGVKKGIYPKPIALSERVRAYDVKKIREVIKRHNEENHEEM